MDLPPGLTASSALLGSAVTLGNLAIWLGLASAIGCVVFYWIAMLRTMSQPAVAAGADEKSGKGVKRNPVDPAEAKTERFALWARRMFFTHGAFILLGAAALFTVILSQQYNVAYVHKKDRKSVV